MSEQFEITFKFDVGTFAVADASKIHLERERQANNSLEMFGSYNEQTRDVLVQIVRRSLESLHTTADYWLPQGLLEGPDGDRIGVQMEILLTDIEAQVDVMEDASEFEVESTKRRITEYLEGQSATMSPEEFRAYCERQTRLGNRLSVSEAKRLLELAPS